MPSTLRQVREVVRQNAKYMPINSAMLKPANMWQQGFSPVLMAGIQ